jgi:hypothetical protein
MKQHYPFKTAFRYIVIGSLTAIAGQFGQQVYAQSCPTVFSSTISSFPNTYYSAGQTTASVGTKSILLGAASYGATPISAGDVLLVIQTQGAQINSNNNSQYGQQTTAGNGYLNNVHLLAGNMEFVAATNNVPLTGGTLHLVSGLVNAYQTTPYGSDGQYSYQIIRVPVYNNIKLLSTINVPVWNGSTGGVLVLYATDSLLFNGQTISGAGAGFRGGAGVQLGGSTTGFNYDFREIANDGAGGAKGEGLSGTPRFINYGGAILDNGVEGYKNGSNGQGAPGNAGGGGTDGHPAANDQNTGGGGGGNGGAGGLGGWGWSSASITGGQPGAVFGQVSASHLVMGGGGGAGTTNNGTGSPSNGFASSGTAGGGIVIAMAAAFGGTGKIDVSGVDGNTTVQNDGSGGGGAGGSVMLYASAGTGLSQITVKANGGTGGTNSGNGAKHGPGGGGGGGVIYSNNTLNAASSATGGANGTTFSSSNYGALSGSNGIITQNITQAQALSFPVVCTILPIDFLSLEAAQQDGLVTVQWTVSHEANAREYLVEKSLDGSNFTAIGTVAYRPAVTIVNQYDFTDNNVSSFTGALYYRVKEIDESGIAMYSKIVSVRINGVPAKFSVYPNPANASTTIGFVSSTSGAINLKLFDLKGSLLWKAQYEANTGVNTVPVTVIRNIPDGIYLLEWSDGQAPTTTRLIVRH